MHRGTDADREMGPGVGESSWESWKCRESEGSCRILGTPDAKRKERTSASTCAASVEILEKAFHVAIIEHSRPQI